MKTRTETLDDLIRGNGMLTLEGVAYCAGITTKQLWSLRHGRVRRPHERTVVGLADALGVSLPRLRAALQAAE